MKKKSMVIFMLFVFSVICAEIYTGVPAFLPYGVDSLGNPQAPYWISVKAGPNGFQGCGYYDMNGNLHVGKGNPYLNLFYEDTVVTEIQIGTLLTQIKNIVKAIRDILQGT